MQFPPEILSLSLQHLSKSDLKSARLVCKVYDGAAVPYLFREVFLSINRADLEATELIIRHFGIYVKKLSFSSVYYKAHGRNSFQQATRNQIHGRPKDGCKASHLQNAYQNHYRLREREEQREDRESGMYLAYIIFALQSLPNLKRLILTDFGAGEISTEEQLRGRGFRHAVGVCPLTECKFRDIDHLQYQVRPQSDFSHTAFSPWNVAMLALWSSRQTLKELATLPTTSYLSLRCFEMGIRRPYSLCDIFQSLTNLRLDICIGSQPGDTLGTRCYTNGYVSQALSAARNLEFLCLWANVATESINYELITIFQSLLGTCRFPKLRSLILNSKTWEELAIKMRESLSSLKDIEVSCLYGGRPVTCRGGFNVPIVRVRDFFFRNGANPFSEQALLTHEVDGDEEAHEDGTVGAEARYERFH
ncbi:MAG: hypothetical protein ASARMPREDX12_004223 [Alectoria sarmentosa]|nr:MAG: hypothetical protein ASARMPREDX12_004223 [Alectoria sarmentosa]